MSPCLSFPTCNTDNKQEVATIFDNTVDHVVVSNVPSNCSIFFLPFFFFKKQNPQNFIASMPSVCGERLRQPDTRGDAEGPWGAAGREAPPHALGDLLAQRGAGGGGPAREVFTWLLISLMNFTSSPRKRFSRKPQTRSLYGQNSGHADPKGPGSGSSSGPGQLLRVPPPPRRPQLILGRLLGVHDPPRWLLRALLLLLRQLSEEAKKRPAPSRATPRSANRRPGRGKRRRPAEAGWPGCWLRRPPPWITDESEAQGW